MLLISRSMGLWKRLVFLLYVHVINVRFQIFQSSVYSFSSEYLLLFLKSSSCVLFLPTLLTSVICPSMTKKKGNIFLEYLQSNLLFSPKVPGTTKACGPHPQ